MREFVSIPNRFRGPANSGQGGYSAGLAASFVDGTAHVRLRRPPPLDRRLSVDTTPEGASVLDGEAVVLVATRSDLDVFPPVDPRQLAAIFERGPQPAPSWHMAPTCFVCGTPESLGMHPTRIEEIGVWATAWTPQHLAGESELEPEIVWALLDCPAGWATTDSQRPERSFFPALVEMTVEIAHPVPLGQPVAILGWMTSEGERRIDCESAIMDRTGTVLASASLSQAVVQADWGVRHPD